MSRGLVDLRNPIQRQLFEARAIMLAVRTAAMILRAIILRSPVGLKVPRAWFQARYANMHGFIFSFYGALLCLSGKVWAPQMKGTSPFSPPMYDHRHLKLIHSAIRGALQSAAILSLQLNAANALAAEQTAPIIVEIDVRKPVATFLPSDVFGAGVDGLGQNGIARTYQPANIQEMNSSGFSRLSYRLRTELGVEAWHWNEEGSWSDPERSQGYWSSSDTAFQPVLISHGYRLPRRGNTNRSGQQRRLLSPG